MSASKHVEKPPSAIGFILQRGTRVHVGNKKSGIVTSSVATSCNLRYSCSKKNRLVGKIGHCATLPSVAIENADKKIQILPIVQAKSIELKNMGMLHHNDWPKDGLHFQTVYCDDPSFQKRVVNFF